MKVAATTPLAPKMKTILFFGSRSLFPDVYPRFIASGFENFDVSIVPTLSSAKGRLKTEPYVAVTSIFPTWSIEAEPECLFESSDLVPQFHPVCAYQNVEDNRSLINAIGGTELMAKLGFLPLRTRIDSVINILSLLVSGPRHICGDIMDYLWARIALSQQKSGQSNLIRSVDGPRVKKMPGPVCQKENPIK